MEHFEIKNSGIKMIDSLKRLLQEGKKYGLNLDDLIAKNENTLEALNRGVVSVVLLGSFTDGKTTAIAGLLGRLEDSMKIDVDESSDELTIYRPDGLRKGFEIVDTPGLFGTKEKEVNGKMVKFSELTERYISEAHILIYVCDATNPLKDSHVDILKRILRTYNKLPNTIFVLNKMDEAGYDPNDNDDFKRGVKIKTETFKKRLNDAIELSWSEARHLKIVCIAADPKGAGLEYWFAKPDEYYKRSHISELRDIINKVTDECNIDKTLMLTAKDAVFDVTNSLSVLLDGKNGPLAKAIVKLDEIREELESDLSYLRKELVGSKKILKERLSELKTSVLADLRGSSMETINDVINSSIGVQGNNITFYELKGKINSIIDECVEANSCYIQTELVRFEESFNKQNGIVLDALKYGSNALKNLTVSGELVKSVRDIVASGYKFKPWGAINLGKNITKAAGIVGNVISIGLSIYNWVKKHDEEKKFLKLKDDLIKAVNDIFASLVESFDNDSTYYENYAPKYVQLVSVLKEREKEITNLKNELKKLQGYKERIDKWMKNAENAKFEEV